MNILTYEHIFICCKGGIRISQTIHDSKGENGALQNELDEICCDGGQKAMELTEKMPDEEILYDTGDFFKTLGDSTRIKILFALLGGALCVGEIACGLNLTQSAVSHQLRVLRNNGLVKYQKDGKSVIYSLDDEHVEDILKVGLAHVKHKRGSRSM